VEYQLHVQIRQRAPGCIFDIDAAEIGEITQPSWARWLTRSWHCSQLVEAAKTLKHRHRGDLKQKVAAGRRHSPPISRASIIPTSTRCGRSASWANSARRCRGRHRRHRRRLEQEWRGAAVPVHQPGDVHHPQRPGDHGIWTRGGPGREIRPAESSGSCTDRRWRFGAANPMVGSQPRWKPKFRWSG